MDARNEVEGSDKEGAFGIPRWRMIIERRGEEAGHSIHMLIDQGKAIAEKRENGHGYYHGLRWGVQG